MAKLTINEAAQGYTHKFAFDYNDLLDTTFLSNLGAAGQKVIGKQLPGDVIDVVALYQITAAAGAATDLTLDVGNQTNDPDELLDAAALSNLGTTPMVYNTGDEFVTSAKMSVVNNTTAAKTIYMEANPATGLTALTAGSWILAWRQLVTPKV